MRCIYMTFSSTVEKTDTLENKCFGVSRLLGNSKLVFKLRFSLKPQSHIRTHACSSLTQWEPQTYTRPSTAMTAACSVIQNIHFCDIITSPIDFKSATEKVDEMARLKKLNKHGGNTHTAFCDPTHPSASQTLTIMQNFAARARDLYSLFISNFKTNYDDW